MANWDARWNIVAGSVDDRTEEERDPKSEAYLPNARYSEANLYLWEGEFHKPEYNDMKININPETVEYLRKAAKELNIEIDEPMVQHISNIFKREIMVVHEKFKTMGDDQNTLF